MSDTYQPGQPVYVSATFVRTSGAAAVVTIDTPNTKLSGPDLISTSLLVPLSSLSAAPSPQQIEDLREAMDQIAPTGPDGSP